MPAIMDTLNKYGHIGLSDHQQDATVAAHRLWLLTLRRSKHNANLKLQPIDFSRRPQANAQNLFEPQSPQFTFMDGVVHNNRSHVWQPEVFGGEDDAKHISEDFAEDLFSL